MSAKVDGMAHVLRPAQNHADCVAVPVELSAVRALGMPAPRLITPHVIGGTVHTLIPQDAGDLISAMALHA